MSQSKTYNARYQSTLWGLSGICLAILFYFVSSISNRFGYEINDLNKPIIILVLLLMASGAVYLFVILYFKNPILSGRLLVWIFVVGMVMRLVLFSSKPMLEDDHYRYLWDGAVLANGFNPYKYAPSDILHKKTNIPNKLQELANESHFIIKRINYPWLKTIYPPLTEAAFGLSYFLKPWSLDAWRLILLSMDLLTLFLIFIVLKDLKLPLVGLAIYWWNPLLAKEIYNSAHMDVLLFPFILASLFFTLKQRYILSASMLSLSVGIKFWPAILLPVILRPVLRNLRILIPALLLFTAVSILMFLPLYTGGLDSGSGFIAYGKKWEMNDSLFMIFLWGNQLITNLFNINPGYAQIAARAMVSCIICVWIFLLILKNAEEPIQISRRFLLIIAAFFLLSPTQFPWYFTWALPLLAIKPYFSLIVLTFLLPLYYLRFYFSARDLTSIHDNWIVWVEFVPVWFLILLEWRKGNKN